MVYYQSDPAPLPELTEQEFKVANQMGQATRAGYFVREKFDYAKLHRETHEQRWSRYFDQFRGRYSSEEQMMLSRIREKNPYASEAFIKITKTKTLAAYGSVIEVLTAGNQFPISVDCHNEPEGIAKEIYEDTITKEPDAQPIEELAGTIGYDGDGQRLEPGTTTTGILGGLSNKLSKILKGGKFVVGESPNPIDMPKINPAKIAAEKMNETIQDQLMQNKVLTELEKAIWEQCVLGTGIIKGPFTNKEIIPFWKYEKGMESPVYEPKYKITPVIKAPSIWNIYPDPYATEVSNADFIIERHKMTRSELQALMQQPAFDPEAIKVALRSSPNVIDDHWEHRLRDSNYAHEDNRFEVLEFWGKMSVELAREVGISGIPAEFDGYQMLDVHIWECNGTAIRKQLNPFIPERLPYMFIPFEVQPYQLWGIGVPENMEDAQRMINVHTRAAQDNLRLAGSCMLEVNEAQLAPGQDSTIYAGKIWRRQGGAPNQSIYPITFNNTAPQHLQFIGEANRMADQGSGIPSVLHGQTGVSGTGRTATTMSMIMNGGNLSIRTVIKNIDRSLLKPLGEALFNWNMQFNMDTPEIRGDLKIIARGAAALAQREVQSQRLLTFLQILSNPVLAPYGKMDYIIRELAKTLELNPNEVVNDLDTIKMFMKLQGPQNAANSGTGQEASQQPNPDSTGTPQGPVSDTAGDNLTGAGGGNIGVDTAAVTR